MMSKGGKKTKAVKGVSNIGNTCFMAAALQCLSHTFAFQKILRHVAPYSEGTVSAQQRLAIAVRNFFLFQWQGGDSKAGPFNPEEVLVAVQRLNSVFHGYHQHDAMEFLRFVLSTMNDLEDSSLVSRVFMGKTCSTVTCLKCMKESTCVEDFLDLSLSIPSEPIGDSGDNKTSFSIWQKIRAALEPAAKVSLRDCFLNFLKTEHLSGSDAYFCEHCKARADCLKRISIQKLPETLIVHLKRFKHEWTSSKISKSVTFPIGSDLEIPETDPSCSYRLSGIVQHSGSLSSGHYTAFCRHKSTGQWYFFDDARVSLVSNLSLIENAEAYVFFFQKVVPPSVFKERVRLKQAIIVKSFDTEHDVRFIPRAWVCAVKSMAHIPEILDFSKKILCIHKRPSTICSEHAKALFVPVRREYMPHAEVVAESLEVCAKCEKFVLAYNFRLAWEQKLVNKLDSKHIPEDQVWFLIDAVWIADWRKYIRVGAIADVNRAVGPGKINNEKLIEKMGTNEVDKLKLTSDFVAVNRDVWALFAHCHGLDGRVITNKTLSLKNAAISHDSTEQEAAPPALISAQDWENISQLFVDKAIH